MPRTLCLTLLASSLCSTAIADTLHVPSQFATIQDAIDQAVDGDVVQLAAGTFNESSIDLSGKAITVRGAVVFPGGPMSVINGQGNGPIFIAQSGETSDTSLEYLILQGGTSTVGGALVLRGSDVSVSDCVFTGNQANNGGGAVAVGSGANPTFEDCTFYMNSTSSSGGAVWVVDSSATFQACEFTYNASEYAGGAIYAEDSDIAFNFSKANQNTAPQRGAAIAAFQSSLSITYSELSHNTSGYDGGAVHAHTSEVEIAHSHMFENDAETGSGGAVNVYQSSVDIQHSEFNQNTSHEHGGALFIRFGSGSTVSHSSFFNNSTDGQGGAAAHINTSAFWKNCDVNTNSAGSNGGGLYNFGSQVNMVMSTVQENESGALGGGVSSILSDDPVLSSTEVCGNMPDQFQGTWEDGGDSLVADQCSLQAYEAPCCVATGCAFTSEDLCDQLGGLWLDPMDTCDDCPEVCLTDLNGDGLTDLNDLLAMIASWGPCL